MNITRPPSGMLDAYDMTLHYLALWKEDLHLSKRRWDKSPAHDPMRLIIAREAALAAANRYEITNVAQWTMDNVFQESSQLFEHVKRYIPCAAPLGDMSWLEYESMRPADLKPHERLRVGVLVGVCYDRETATPQDTKTVDDFFTRPFRESEEVPVLKEYRWVLSIEVWDIIFSSRSILDTHLFMPSFMWYVILSPTGELNDMLGIPHPLYSCRYGEVSMDRECNVPPGITHALVAHTFMHCKNVIRKPQSPTRQIVRQLQRAGKTAYSWHTIDIEGMTRIIRDVDEGKGEGQKKRLHVCRGHFAHYDEKPLFGKVKGTFYVPQHTRGSALLGRSGADYKVKAARA